MILRLVYVSAATHPLDADDLAELLQRSRARNEAVGITGVLLYQDGSIIQVLEGDPDVVRGCYEQIQQDPRHARVTRVFEEEDTRREFDGWSMGFLDAGALRPADLAAFTHFLTEDAPPGGMGAGAVRDALLVFRDNLR